jgi:hypothetical protein
LPCASEVVPRTAKDRRRPVGHRDMPGPAAEEDSSASEQGAEDFEDAPSPERGATVVRHSPEICPRRCTLPSPTSRKGTPISSSRSPRKLRCARSPDDGRVAAAGPTAAAAAAPRPATAATAARAREDGGRESRPPSGAPRLPPLAPERHPRRRRRRRLPAPPRAVPQLGGEGQGKALASRLPLLMGQKSTTTLPLWSACAPESVRARSHGLSQGIERPARDGLGPKCKRWHPEGVAAVPFLRNGEGKKSPLRRLPTDHILRRVFDSDRCMLLILMLCGCAGLRVAGRPGRPTPHVGAIPMLPCGRHHPPRTAT